MFAFDDYLFEIIPNLSNYGNKSVNIIPPFLSIKRNNIFHIFEKLTFFMLLQFDE